jgi:hypothetical protein
MARKPPHHTTYPARAWAELLGLQDPEGNGARHIIDAVTWLTRAGFVRVERKPGKPSILYLLDDAGTRKDYRPPHRLRRPYVKVPSCFWTKGWHTVLSGTAVALLLVMLDQQSYKPAENSFWVSPSRAKELYALSPDTWTRGVAELRVHGLVDVVRIPVSLDFGWRRLRNTYRLNLRQLEEHPYFFEEATS